MNTKVRRTVTLGDNQRLHIETELGYLDLEKIFIGNEEMIMINVTPNTLSIYHDKRAIVQGGNGNGFDEINGAVRLLKLNEKKVSE